MQVWFAGNWQLLTRSVVNLVWSHVYHTEQPPYLFASHLHRVGLSGTGDPCFIWHVKA